MTHLTTKLLIIGRATSYLINDSLSVKLYFLEELLKCFIETLKLHDDKMSTSSYVVL